MAEIYSMKDIKNNVKKPKNLAKKDEDYFSNLYKKFEEARITKDSVEGVMKDAYDSVVKNITTIVKKDEKGKVVKGPDGKPLTQIDNNILVYGGKVDYVVGDKKIVGKRSAEEIKHDLYEMIIHNLAKEHEKYNKEDKKTMNEQDYFSSIENKYGFNRMEFVKHLTDRRHNIEDAFKELSKHYSNLIANRTKEALTKDLDVEDIETFHKYISKNASKNQLADHTKYVRAYDNNKKQVMSKEEAIKYVTGILGKDVDFISKLDTQRYHTNLLINSKYDVDSVKKDKDKDKQYKMAA